VKVRKSAREVKGYLNSHVLARKRSGPSTFLVGDKEETESQAKSALELECGAQRLEQIGEESRTKNDSHLLVTRC
jgi:hypothetical protein